MLPQLYPAALDHFVVVVVTTADDGGDQAVGYDFLPAEPTSPATVVSLLSGGAVPGLLRRRRLRQVPAGRRCMLLGEAQAADPIGTADAFSLAWEPRLVLHTRDCRAFAAGLASALVGEQFVVVERDNSLRRVPTETPKARGAGS